MKDVQNSRNSLREVLYSLSSNDEPRIRNGLASLQTSLTFNLGCIVLQDKELIKNIIAALVTLKNEDSHSSVLECLTLFVINNPLLFCDTMKFLLGKGEIDQFQVLVLLSAFQRGILMIFDSSGLESYWKFMQRSKVIDTSLAFSKTKL